MLFDKTMTEQMADKTAHSTKTAITGFITVITTIFPIVKDTVQYLVSADLFNVDAFWLIKRNILAEKTQNIALIAGYSRFGVQQVMFHLVTKIHDLVKKSGEAGLNKLTVIS